MHLLTAKDVGYHYPDKTDLVIENFNLQVHPGEILQLSGRNGAGKTTALKLLAGLLQPTSGLITPDASAHRIYMDQKASEMLATDLSVADHFRAFLNVDADAMTLILEDLQQFDLGLETLLDQFAGQLSGGQSQILALILTLMGKHNLLFLDEFTAHLDPKSTEIANALVSRAVSEQRKSVVLVSHLAVGMAVNKSIEINASDGVQSDHR